MLHLGRLAALLQACGFNPELMLVMLLFFGAPNPEPAVQPEAPSPEPAVLPEAPCPWVAGRLIKELPFALHHITVKMQYTRLY